MNEQAAEEEKVAKRQAVAKQRAARERVTRLESALREVERLQKKKKEDKKTFVARASTTDAEAHVMRNGEGGTVPSYNVQLVTDTTHGFVVNVEATTDAIDYRQLEPALDRCKATLGCLPKQLIADGDYTNHAAVQAAAKSGVDFYGSWQDSWKPTEADAQGRSGAFISSAFPYDAKNDVYLCPAGQQLVHKTVLDRGHGVRTHVYKAPKAACASCVYRTQCASKKPTPKWRRSITRMEESAQTSAFKAKMQSEAAQKIYKQRSQIAEFPHAWIKERCGLGNFAAEGKRKPAWKLPGRVLVTTSSGYLAYAARLLTQLSLLHKKSQCSRYGRRSEATGLLNGEIMGRQSSHRYLSTRSLSPAFKLDHGTICTTPGAIFHSSVNAFPRSVKSGGRLITRDKH